MSSLNISAKSFCLGKGLGFGGWELVGGGGGAVGEGGKNSPATYKSINSILIPVRYRYATTNYTNTSQRSKNANRKITPPGQSEVGNLDATLVRHEEVGNLQVSVHDEV